MKRFNEYASDAAEFAEPYAKKTVQFFCDTKDAIEDRYTRGKKRRLRKRRIVKIKEFLESTIGVVLIVLTFIAGAAAIIKFASKISGSKPRVRHVGGHNSAEGVSEQEPEAGTEKPKKHRPEKNSGYITL